MDAIRGNAGSLQTSQTVFAAIISFKQKTSTNQTQGRSRSAPFGAGSREYCSPRSGYADNLPVTKPAVSSL